MSPANQTDTSGSEPKNSGIADPDLDNDTNEGSTEDDVVSSDNSFVHRERRWLMLIVYFIVALAFAVLVVFFGRWLYHTVHKNKKVGTNTTTTQTKPAPATPTTPPAQTTPTPSNNSTNNAPSTPTNGSTAQPRSQTGSQLPNNGPGDVIGLFVGTAILIGGLHFVYNLRRVS